MKSPRRLLALALLSLPATLAAQTTLTPSVGLEVPARGSNNWDIPMRYDFNRLDQLLSGGIALPSLKVSGDVQIGGTATAGSFAGLNGAYFLQSTSLGVNSGIATLDSTGHLTQAQIPTNVPKTGNDGRLPLSTLPALLTADCSDATHVLGYTVAGGVECQTVSGGGGGYENLSESTDGTMLTFDTTPVTGQFYSILRAKGTSFSWLQLGKEENNDGRSDARLILRNDGTVQLEALSNDGSNTNGFGEAAIWQFTPTSTLSAASGRFGVNFPSDVSVYDATSGYDRGLAGGEAGYSATSDTGNFFGVGIRAMHHHAVSFNGGPGDINVDDWAIGFKNQTAAASAEGFHASRRQIFEQQTALGTFLSTTAAPNGDQYLTWSAIINQYQIGNGMPFIDGTQEQDVTVTAASGGTATVSNTLTPSTDGTLNANVATPPGSISDGYVASVDVTYPGPNPAGLEAMVSGPGGNPEKVLITAATPISGGFNVTANWREFHGQSDRFSIGGLAGRLMQAEALPTPMVHAQQYYPQLLPNRHLMWILGNTANVIQTGFASYSATGSNFMSVGPHAHFPGALVVDVRPSPTANTIDGQTFKLAANSVAWAANDQVEQENPINESIDVNHDLYQVYNPYANVDLQTEAFQVGVAPLNGVIHDIFLPAGSGAVMNHYGSPPNSGPVSAAGPAVVYDFAPSVSGAGGNCTGLRTTLCVANEEPGVDHDFLTAIFDYNVAPPPGADGVQELHMAVNTQTRRITQSGTDFTGRIAVLMNAQVGGLGEYAFQAATIGVPALGAMATTDSGGNLQGRFGFAGDHSLTSGGGGGFISRWHVSAALNASVINANFWQLEGHSLVVIGADTDSELAMSVDPVTHTVAARAFAPYSDTPPAGTSCNGATGAVHPANSIWADDSFVYHCNAAGTAVSRAELTTF